MKTSKTIFERERETERERKKINILLQRKIIFLILNLNIVEN